MLWGDWRVCVIETPRSSLDKRCFFRKPTFNSLYTPFGSPVSGGQKPSLPLRKAPPFSPSLSSIVFTPPSVPTVLGDRNPQGREDVTALRCSEPLRYKVGGASKPCAMVLRDGTAWGCIMMKIMLKNRYYIRISCSSF